jgi:DNA-binding CsgD family transcriptional regulator
MPLPERQREVLDLLVQGKSYKEIAEILKLHYRAVQGRMEVAKDLANARTQAQLIALYVKGLQ